MSTARQLLDKDSSPCGVTELDLFSLPPTQVSVEDSFFTDVQPQTTVTNEGPWEFRLPGNQFMTDLSKNYMFIRLKITQGNGNNLPVLGDGRAHPWVGPVNLLGKTLFQQLRLYLNGKLVYDSTDTYAYSAYLMTVLNYGKESKYTQLFANGYVKDTATSIDTAASLPTNDGWVTRGNQYHRSHLVELMAPLDFPLAHQERFLPSNVTISVSLDRHKDPFILLSPEANPTYKIQIDDIRWKVRQVQVTPALEMTLRNVMQKQMARYPVRRTQIRTMYMTPGSRHSPPNSIWNGQIPRRIVIGMVAEAAFNGNYALSPFNFRNFGLIKSWVVANGETYPKRGRPLQCRFDDAHGNEYMELYVNFYEAIGLGGKDKGVDLTFEDLKLGHCLVVVDMKANSGSDDAGWEAVRTGNTSVHLELGEDVPAGGIRVICMGEFDNLMTIDSNLNVYSDFAI